MTKKTELEESFSILKGETITEIKERKLKEGKKETDDEGDIILTTKNGKRFHIYARYGTYTGESADEYPYYLGIDEEK